MSSPKGRHILQGRLRWENKEQYVIHTGTHVFQSERGPYQLGKSSSNVVRYGSRWQGIGRTCRGACLRAIAAVTSLSVVRFLVLSSCAPEYLLISSSSFPRKAAQRVNSTHVVQLGQVQSSSVQYRRKNDNCKADDKGYDSICMVSWNGVWWRRCIVFRGLTREETNEE